MTEREIYRFALIENNKVEAPSLLLDDFNYLINKAIQQYINKSYNRYEINQQVTDDLRVLKTSARIPIIVGSHDEDGKEVENYAVPDEFKEYYCKLPYNYLHLLNCVVSYDKNGEFKPTHKCDQDEGADGNVWYPAHKLTADMEPSILVNAYLKPSYKMPYYYINNVEGISTRDEIADELFEIVHPDEKLPKIDSGIRMQIRCGKTDKFVPAYAYINYIRKPRKVHLTYAELDGVDKSQKLEFPDYVCYEIINEFTKLILENASDPRLQSHIPINQTIATVKDNK